ncbi:MAG: insulinase family protein [Luteitalea sp.]|nr:insulinase family protein [Luteitalea sp.]
MVAAASVRRIRLLRVPEGKSNAGDRGIRNFLRQNAEQVMVCHHREDCPMTQKTTWRAFAVAVLVLTTTALACSSSGPDAPAATTTQASDIPKIDFEKFTLPNGLEVLLSEDRRLPLVAVNLWYHVGPANEAEGRTGFAHLFEHMMFQGSKHAPGDMHFRTVEGAGGSTINGTTDFDRTNYFETLPANQLELGLWLESDRMGYLLDMVDQANLSNQQDVVRNERRQSVENQPYGVVEEAMFHQLFPRNHPYYASVIGSHADIQAAKLEDVQNFFKLYYAPNNASLAIVGDIDKAATRALVEKYFGSFKQGQPVPKPNVETPAITAERRQVVKDRIELPRVYMAWLTSPIYQPGDADADIAATALGGGRSSRLYKKLVYEKQIAQDVQAQQYSLQLGSVFSIQATARPGHSAEELEKAIDEELSLLGQAGPDATEVERARNVIETRIVQGLESLGGFGGVADRLNMYNHYLGDPAYLPKDIERYRAVTPATVKAFVQEQLTPNARVVVHGVPGEPDLGTPVPTPAQAKAAPGAGAQSVNADEPWRNEPPKAAEARALKLPEPTSFQLPNGLTVLVNERPGLPIVSANLVVKTGSGANPAAKPGLANFAAAMLDEGAGSRSALQIADEVARLGGSLTTGSTMDASQASASSLQRTFPQMLDLLADVVRRPSFPAEELERQKASRLASLVQQRENANAVATAVMSAALYGPSHPYGYTELGTETSNKTMTREDLQKFWAQNFVPNNAALVVSGNITTGELRPLVEKAFSDWPKGTPAENAVGAPATTSARLVVVDKPGAPQTQVRVASIGVPRNTPDYETLLILNEALGGLFSSRINLNLREQHGYTYGASSQFLFRRSAGPFLVASGVRTDVTAPAVSEILKELSRIRDGELGADELTLAKDSLVRSLPSQFETSGRVTGSTTNIYVYDLGLDYYSRLPGRLTAVDAAGVKAAALKYVLPEKMLVVLVGDRARIAADMQKLNLGRAELRNPDGTPAARGTKN